MTTEGEVNRVLADLPDLKAYGFDSGSPLVASDDFIAQVNAARRWAAAPPRGEAMLLRRDVSYSVKRFAEAFTGVYISNSAMIVGAVLAGWVPVRHWRFGLNCRFKLPPAQAKNER